MFLIVSIYLLIAIIVGVSVWLCLHQARVSRRRQCALWVGALWPVALLLLVMIIIDEVIENLFDDGDAVDDDYDER